MPYTYLPEIATADVAFRATGKTLDDLFAAAADATTGTMVDDLSTIMNEESIDISLSHEEVDLLLFDFLNELVFLKDARQLLLRAQGVAVTRNNSFYSVQAALSGERIDPMRHPLKVDVKAVTLHLFEVKQTAGGWETTVVLDV
jgi:SHS2 domain-containing protein